MDRDVVSLGCGDGLVYAGRFLVVVEKLWESLLKSLWESSEKVLRKLWESGFYTNLVGKSGVLHCVVEKFYKLIYTSNNRLLGCVFHIFHIAYYYYY